MSPMVSGESCFIGGAASLAGFGSVFCETDFFMLLYAPRELRDTGYHCYINILSYQYFIGLKTENLELCQKGLLELTSVLQVFRDGFPIVYDCFMDFAGLMVLVNRRYEKTMGQVGEIMIQFQQSRAVTCSLMAL